MTHQPLLLQVDKTWTPPLTSPPAVLAFDTEYLNEQHNQDFKVLCCSWAWDYEVGYMCTIDQLPPAILQWLEDPNVTKVGHNIKTDAIAMSLHLGRRLYLWPFRDTRHMWASVDESAIDEGKASGKAYATIFPSLKVLARRAGCPRWTAPEDLFLKLQGVSTKTKDRSKFWAAWAKLWDEAPDLMKAYAAMDGPASWLLDHTLWAELSEPERAHFRFKMLVERSFIDVEMNGIETDVEQLTRELRPREQEHAELSARVMEATGLTKLQGPQVVKHLYETLGCPRVAGQTDAGADKADKEALEVLRNHDRTPEEAVEFIVDLQRLRALEAVIKQLRTYFAAVRDDGRIHATFNLSGTRTGRTSSAVNVQNPARTGPVRSCFVSRFS